MAEGTNDRVIVTVEDQHLPTIHAVVQALQAAGMQVSNVLSNSGIVTGQVPQGKRSALSAVPGVAAVETDGEMHAI
jgi:hypothetical protein